MTNRPFIAVTLGSNGFHLFEVVVSGSKMETTQHFYESVAAESYLDDDAVFSEEGIEKILGVLQRFGNYIQSNPESTCAAIATGSFRRARNSDAVIKACNAALGIPVKVLTGKDESLLCYMGIASSAGFAAHNRLVMDIGGGSTELMIARKNTLIRFFSLDLGCVSLTRRFFNDGKMSEVGFSDGVEYASQIIEPVAGELRDSGWEEVMGCGGTVSSLYSVLQTQRMAGRFITGASLLRFQDTVVEAGSASPLCESIVQRDRTRVLPAGVCILAAAYNVLGIESLAPVFSSVGQGLLVQMIQQRRFENRSDTD